MATYMLISTGVIRLDDGAAIPSDPANSDWQAYLKSVAAGAVPRPLSPGPQYDWSGSAWVANVQRQALLDAGTQLGVDLTGVKASGLIVAFLKMSPAQIDQYLAQNVTNLAQARDVLGMLAKVVSVIGRAQIAG